MKILIISFLLIFSTSAFCNGGGFGGGPERVINLKATSEPEIYDFKIYNGKPHIVVGYYVQNIDHHFSDDRAVSEEWKWEKAYFKVKRRDLPQYILDLLVQRKKKWGFGQRRKFKNIAKELFRVEVKKVKSYTYDIYVREN